MNSVILRVVARLNLYVFVFLGVYLWWRGHNSPGGGFVAGLIITGAIVLQAVAYNSEYAAQLLPFRSERLIATGLLLAVGTGVAPMLLGHELLNQTFGFWHLPFIGDLEWTTAAIFDVAVMFVVTGVGRVAILTIAGDVDKKE